MRFCNFLPCISEWAFFEEMCHAWQIHEYTVRNLDAMQFGVPSLSHLIGPVVQSYTTYNAGIPGNNL